MSRTRELTVLEQVVPSAACFQCDVCCRFPEANSPLRPYFTREEIESAIAAGVPPAAFPDVAGSKVTLRPYGEGYTCPAFDTGTGRCGIYSIRPLDCRLYPIAVMWDDNHGRVVMGWDPKCPYIVEELENPAVQSYVERTAAWLESDAIAAVFVANPQLVGAYQEDVAILRPLPRISEGLREPIQAGGAGDVGGVGLRAVNARTRRLTLADRGWVEALLLAHAPQEPLAAYSFQYHFVWQDLFRYEWMELDGHCCLLARDQEGSFLALPPLGPDPCGPVMAEVFSLLAQANPNHSMSRIENVPRTLADRCRAQGYRVLPKRGDYLYERESLVALKGNPYKGQRAAYNHCLQYAHPSFRPYEPADMEACLALFERWRGGVKEDESGYARHMASDAVSVHRFVLHHAADLGLMGRVVEVGGQVSAYTFGYPLTSSTFCILLEIADRTVKGLPQYIFREFCRELSSYRFINAMDDSGLAGLRYAKELYRPVRFIESYIVTPAPA